MVDHRLYWIWFAEKMGQGSRLASKLINLFGSAVNIYESSEEEIDGYDPSELSDAERTAVKRILSDKSLGHAEDIMARAEELGMKVLVPTDRGFPRGLLNLRDTPMVLYTLGNLPNFERELCISVVGTRKMSDSGRQNAFAIGCGLAAGGAAVISGMALGIDGMALCGAIMGGGSPVAVLGGGADVIYPKDHERLYNVLLSSGAIVSEYPPGTPPVGYHFPVRNRIISGLSSATVIVEADYSSGALITARHALFQGRILFSVPGDVSSHTSDGTNDLIKSGAITATGAEDILKEFEYIYPQNVSIRSFKRTMGRIDVEAASADAMARMRITARGGGNYYGKGSYGGRQYGQSSGVPKYDATVGAEGERSAEYGSGGGREPYKKPSVRDGSARKTTGGNKDRVKNAKSGGRAVQAAAPAKSSPHIDVDLLDEVSIKVYRAMKPDVPMTADELVSSELSIGDVLSSLSLLEIAGAIEAGAGGYYLRLSSEDITLDNTNERK